MQQEQQQGVQQAETQDSFGPLSITKLEINGITAADIKKLQEVG
jgi:hypothetical protein